jgi:hypothetical protein
MIFGLKIAPLPVAEKNKFPNLQFRLIFYWKKSIAGLMD